ncbi:MAG: hypothetical protein K6G81_12545 [Lachnospiraceae bacterium]|nr:hypothetical protein [Lachnospiraceae bacterium]
MIINKVCLENGDRQGYMAGLNGEKNMNIVPENLEQESNAFSPTVDIHGKNCFVVVEKIELYDDEIIQGDKKVE